MKLEIGQTYMVRNDDRPDINCLIVINSQIKTIPVYGIDILQYDINVIDRKCNSKRLGFSLSWKCLKKSQIDTLTIIPITKQAYKVLYSQ